MDDLLREFLAETVESLAALDSALIDLEKSADPAALQSIFRVFHTIKGTCGFFALPRLERVAHAAENVLARLRDGELEAGPDVVGAIFLATDRIKEMLSALAQSGAEPRGDDRDVIARLEALGKAAPAPADEPQPQGAAPARELAVASETIRVNVALLDQLMTTASELVLTRNQLLQVLRNDMRSTFAAPLQRLSQVTTELQETVMRTRMQPIGNVWSKLPRLVREVARELGKTISLDMRGSETELDRQVLELIRDPITHMVRNAADHGIEPPTERARAGKPAVGRISVNAFHEGGHVVIEVTDDGRGFALDRIKARAVSLGLASEADLAALSEREIRDFVFRPGFSTAERVTSISGRGVGLDVVRANLERLGGTIDIDSAPGHGTTFKIVLPLTLAIVSALIVESGGERFALPQMAVLELVQVGGEHKIEWLNRVPVLRLRDRLLPIVWLRRLLGQSRGETAGEPIVIVTEAAGRTFGIMVDAIADAEEIVVKPVGPVLRGIPIFAGNTILGDGRVVFILDPAGIAAAKGGVGISAAATPAAPVPAPKDHGEQFSLLLFRAGTAGVKAIPLGVVGRLEEIDLADVEFADGKPVVQYRGRLMPLAAMSSDTFAGARGRRPLIVLAQDEDAVGLVVDAIEDIVEEAVAIERPAGQDGLIASAIIAGKATDIIDAGYYLKAARGLGQSRKGPAPRHVLLIENNAFFRTLLVPVLRAAGYEVVSVASVEEARALCASGKSVDAILADEDTPGIEAFARSLDSGEWRGKPLVALADHGDTEGRFPAAVQKLDSRALLDTLGRALRPQDAA
ncbi:MAG TPA: hybrid sensor histidine kinase/response regulator [Stellaceae bacterium]|nr:hybrid sensor histidine kinase/response regulator [Stellaceae bacterium]